jgi:acyl-CoA thioesterase I
MVAKNFLIISLFLLFQSATTTKTIVFYGDSVTAGYGLSAEEAFPALIGRKLAEKGKDVKVINAGLSGETSAGGLTRIDWILRQPVDVFVLELGPNDGLRGLPLDQTEKNLQSIIDRVKAKYPKAHIVIAGMMVPPNIGQDYTEKFRKIYPALARKNNATLIPFLLQDVAGNEKLNLEDGIHPNAEGHKIVADNVLKFIEPLL